MRLIDADSLKSWIDCGHLRPPTELCFSELDVVKILDKRPTIDAVPVVRCKDCKHWGMLEGPPETENIKCCEFGQYMVGENGYCVYGEVKEHD